MATVVAEAFLSAFVEVLMEKIISTEFVSFFRSNKLDVSLLERLKLTLLSLQAVLNDAEEKQITNPAVKQWLDNLREIVFEADDLLDKINTEALRSKMNKVRNILSSNFKQSFAFINIDIQRLFEKLEHFARKGHLLGLKEGVSSRVWNGTPTSSVLVDESAIYGRDGDRKKLKEYLLRASDDGNKIGVISIVGMGGVGKTTLAKLLYNDPEVNEKFDLKGWAYISKDFDIFRVTKTLLESFTLKTIDTNNVDTIQTGFVTQNRTDTSDLNSLQVQLQQSLSHKRFLLVLDDMWDGNYVDWNNLKDIFNAGKMGSKIIITTRDERVALVTQTFLPVHYLTPLQSVECWSLLPKHAFGASNSRFRSNLEAIGKEIAKKCDGLPLAAVALGGLLRAKLSRDDWNDVLRSNIWNLPNVEMQPTFLSSYHYLPAALKRCFAYCSIFPKNSILQKHMVVQLWIAEGLVHKSKTRKSWEKVGEEYFDELVSRSLIHRRYVDGEECYEMHDLNNDLATTVSSPFCIKLDEHELNDKVRHLSYNRRKYDSYTKFDKLSRLKGLRTFLALPLQEPQGLLYSISERVVRDLLPAMKQLRVLSLSNYRCITELPNSIENLICLRYLNLSNTAIEKLPSVTCNLYNLQTLLLFGCWCLIELPVDMGKLVNLRHLDIRDTQLKEMPLQIARLQNLQTLSNFAISNHRDGLKARELGKFPHLTGNLSISELQNITDPFDFVEVNLKMTEQIDNLELQWTPHGRNSSTSRSSQIEALVFEQLQPSTNLKKLTIRGYGGTTFSNWLGDSLFRNMVYLNISGCDHCSLLPPLGQLHGLKKLSIANMKSVKSLGSEFYGSSSCSSFQPFPSLETLEFEEMPNWEEWNLIGGEATEFPSLKNMSLETCPKLKGNVPHNLPLLTALELRECDLLLESRLSDNQIIPLIWSPLSSLQKLTLVCFPSLMSFPRSGLPKTLQSLTIHDCENLEFLPSDSLHDYSYLEDITISYSCNSMTSFTMGPLPVLKNLHLSGCKSLKSIFVAEEDASQSLSLIQSITIWHSDELESFSLGGSSAPNLIRFEVCWCKKLRSLPEPTKTFPYVQELRIVDLINLQSFAKEGLPINLQELTVGGILCNTAITNWGLERLTCLSELHIWGDDIMNILMKMEMPLLPASVISLHISLLYDIKCLNGKWLRHLTSLQNLEFSFCDSLKSLPEQGLPSSLSVLSISQCPLLEARWRRKRGKEWRKISFIPCIVIDNKIIT